MRWPWRRSSDANSSPATQPELSDARNAEPAAQAAAAQTAAWRDLPSGMTVLGAMPATMDAGFSRTLPSRWHNPPALGPLGHDVRTDVPGGLVSGVARTVDPLDTRPADFVWRLPDLTESGAATTDAATGAANAAVRALPQAAPQARSGIAPLGGSAAATDIARGASRTAPLTTRQTIAAPDQTSVLPAQPSLSAQPSLPAQPSVLSPADGAETFTGTGAQPAMVTGTTQTRQALQDAAAAVEARDPRPVPADVTDGPTAAAPDRGVYAEPDPGTSKSPPDAPASGLGTLFTPREARSGSDSQGSAPAVAPLVSRNPLRRSSAQPLVAGPGAQASSAPANLDAGDDLPGAAGVATDSVPIADVDAAAGAGAVPAPDLATTSAEAVTSTSEVEDELQGSPEAAATTEPGQGAARAEMPPDAQAQAPAEPPPSGETPPPTPRSAEPSAAQSAARSRAQSATTTAPPIRTAPIVSATRFVPVPTPISVLRPPAAPIDQPVRAAESVIGSYATAAITPPAARLAPTASSGAQTAQAAVGPVMSAAQAASGILSRSSGQASAQARGVVGRALAEARAVADSVLPNQDAASRIGRSVPLSETSAGNAATPAAATTAAPHDPAALDALARQLYGRFSRHLAGELLVDRERSQFLTDLH